MASNKADLGAFIDTYYPNNTSRDISELDLRTGLHAIVDSMFDLEDNALTGAQALKPNVTSVDDLRGIVTVGIALGVHILFRDIDDLNSLKVYELVAGTDADDAPDVVRPDDYNGGTNEKVWKIAVLGGGVTSFNTRIGAVTLQSTDVTGLGLTTLAGYGITNAYTKTEVDNFLTGLSWKQEVAVATTANITLSGEQTIDGITTSASRILVKNQTTATQNGIYVTAAGSWTRATDADTGAELQNATVLIGGGTVNGNTQWTCTNTAITLGSTNVTFAQISGAGTYTAGTGLQVVGNVFSVTTIPLANGGTNTDLSATGGTAQYLKQATAGGNITVGTIPASDIASGAALTRTSDTNVTLTLGGSPSTSLLAATSLTLGWTGTLAYSRFVDGAGLSVVGRSANSSGVQADIVAGADYNILRRSGTAIGFGAIDLSQAGAVGTSILAVANGGSGLSSLGAANTMLGVNNAGTALEYKTVSNGLTAASGTFKLGGALTGATSLTSNANSQWTFDGTWTATGNNQYHAQIGGTITARGTAADTLIFHKYNPTIAMAANNQVITLLDFSSASINAGAFTGTTTNLIDSTYYRVNFNNGQVNFGSSRFAAIGPGSTAGFNGASNSLRLEGRISSASDVGIMLYSQNSTLAMGTSGTFIHTGIGGLLMQPTISTGNFIAFNIGNQINQTGTASGSFTGVNYNPTVTSVLGTHLAWNSTSGGFYIKGISTGTVPDTITIEYSGLGTTPRDGAGILFTNLSAATLGAQQDAPSITWSGSGFGTTGSAAQNVKMRLRMSPLQGAANPLPRLILESSIAGGAFVNDLVINDRSSWVITTNIFDVQNTTNPATVRNSAGTLRLSGGSSSSVTQMVFATGGATVNNFVGWNFSENIANFTISPVTRTQTGILVDYDLSVSGTAVGSTFTHTALSVKPSFALSGSTLNMTGIIYNPSITATIGTHYGLLIVSGLVGLGLSTPANATLVIAAGTTTQAPFKLTSGTNLTSAVNGVMEYDGTNLFFTRASTTRESVFTGNDGASAPSTNSVGIIVDYYGSSATRVLTTPNSWASVVIAGTTYKIPLYT